MTSRRTGSPARALVLGGGGAVGVGWQTGLITGLRACGVDLAKAEAIVGTSAGALVGALLASGREVTEALSSLGRLGPHIAPRSLAAGNAAFLSAVREASHGTDPRHALKAIGRAALEATTLGEDAYLGLFDTLVGTAWPPGFRCPAIDADTGELVVWNEGSGVPLRAAVASSCALPMLFPAVTIDGRRYMDGGLLSRLNASATPQTDVVVVLSCHPLEPVALETSALAAFAIPAHAELAALRLAGSGPGEADDQLVELLQRLGQRADAARGDSLVERLLRGVKVAHGDPGLAALLDEGGGGDGSVNATFLVRPH
jgi:NTE family protein